MGDIPKPLSATVKESFAYKTIKDRLPVTVTKTIDYLSRFRNELIKKYGEESDDDIKLVIEKLSCLRYELQTDKPYKFLSDEGEDVNIWNDTIKELHAALGEENCTWFKGSWLFGECYLYRRIREAMLFCKTDMRNYDPFEKSKLESCEAGQQSVSKLIRGLTLLEEHKDEEQCWKNFHNIIQALLWSNKNDLSLSSGQAVTDKVSDLINMLESLEVNILCNHIEDLWKYLSELKNDRVTSQKHVRIDIVLDNCGIELASDLILADFLLRHQFVDQIILHGKMFPWFISDVTQADFDYILLQFQSENSICTSKLHSRLRCYLNEGSLKLTFDPFWTLSHSFDQMKRISPDLYAELQKNSSLVIFKGDLNYRKLIGDLNWPLDTNLGTAARDFRPTTFCAVRTLKADLCANIDMNVETNDNFRKLKEAHPTGNAWMNTGEYGVIQIHRV